MLDIDNMNPFDDEGSESPTVAPQDEPAVVDSAKTEADPAPAASTVDPDAEAAEPKAENDNQKDDPKADDEEKPDSDEKSLDDVLADAEKDIANDKHPKWLRANLQNVTNRFKEETEKVKAVYAPLESFGKPDEIVANLELLKGLESFETNPQTGLPEKTVKPFVDKLVETRGPETALALFSQLAAMPSPEHPGWSLVHEVIASTGLDPTRLDDYKAFAASGYQTNIADNPPPAPEDLALVPENLREAFISLSPAERDEMLLLSSQTMERALAGVQLQLDSDRQAKAAEATKAEQEATAKIEAQQQLFQTINTRTGELVDQSGASLFENFTNTLVKADIDKFDAVAIANTISMTLTTGGVEAKATRDALAEIGVKLDASLDTTFAEWQAAAQQAAAFEAQGDKANFAAAFNRFKDLEGQLQRKTAPIVKAIVEHRAKTRAAAVTNSNKAIDKSLIGHGVAAHAGTSRTISAPANGARGLTSEDIDAMNPWG